MPKLYCPVGLHVPLSNSSRCNSVRILCSFRDVGLSDDVFQKFLMAFIIINSVSIGVQGGGHSQCACMLHHICEIGHTHSLTLTPHAELPISDHPGMVVLKEFLAFIDMLTVIVFSVEIILKWLDNFTDFWRDPWNVFDLLVTVLVSLPCSLCIITTAFSISFSLYTASQPFL